MPSGASGSDLYLSGGPSRLEASYTLQQEWGVLGQLVLCYPWCVYPAAARPLHPPHWLMRIPQMHYGPKRSNLFIGQGVTGLWVASTFIWRDYVIVFFMCGAYHK